MRPATYAIHPALRRLRDAWAWARSIDHTADMIGAECPGLRHVAPRDGAFVLQGQTVTGGGVGISITDTDQIVILRTEPDREPTHIVMALPARLRRTMGSAA
ncbi:hypothetical protein GCM10011452_09440 [Gemmobacter lanyuensis]|uniref:Uncharacterized protein n=1 Tax=Gemmobacter lanyuensis TaxID=1054497 RepID=A0A918MI44_9RHOB|nr:hypothetical protein [Gemmobacter lanyuensis]GGW24116.1 hypothetical protein GCM10011452_09440 [Gemmobacter lanyuensis]